MSDATPRLHGSDCLPAEGPIARKVHKVPQDPLRIAAVLEPTVATMSVCCIAKDEATGVTYMDTMGQVALSGPEQGAQLRGPS